MFNLPLALLQMFCLPWTLFFTFGLVKMLFTVGLVIDVFYLWSCYGCFLPLVLLYMGFTFGLVIDVF